MNTTRPTPAATVHESVRTAISTNRDADTGARVQTMDTSRLAMWWEGGELRVRCQSSRVALNADRAQAGNRRARVGR